MIIRTLIAALALATSTAASAHSFWLQTENATPEEGEEVRIDFKIGDAGEEADDWGLYWERIASLRLYGPDGVIDQQRSVRTTSGGEKGGAVITAPGPGSYVLSFESNPSFSDLEGERFNRYLANEGLAAIAQYREANGLTGENGTELYARRAKTLLQVGDEGSANITRPIGQLLEIVPLSNPFTMAEGDELPVQVLWRGEPLEGVTMHVTRPAESPAAEAIVTDADGRANVALKWGSWYLLTAVWGVPAPGDARADYFTIFSSLTFSSPAPAPAPVPAPAPAPAPETAEQ